MQNTFKYLRLTFLLFTFILCAASLSAQDTRKYFIFFKDKGEHEILSKSSASYQKILGSLDRKAIERRSRMSPDIISYEDYPVSGEYIRLLESRGLSVIQRLDWFNAVSVMTGTDKTDEIKSLPFVREIVPVKSLYFRGETESPARSGKNIAGTNINYGSSFFQLALSDVTAVHSAGITGSGVRVGVLDTGFDWQNHESLKSRGVLAEKDFIFNDNITANEAGDAVSQHNHGTYVFSILGGYKDSMMIGAAYGASFLLAKTEDVRSEKHIEEDNYAAALQWMENKGADITSSSLGYNTFDAGETSYTYADMDGKTTIITKAAELAFSKGVLTISSAGNEGDDAWYHIMAPADGIYTIAVGAVSNDDSVALFSSRGPTADGRIKPDLVTQGVMVFGARAGTTGEYLLNSGTSAAAPIASGIAALLLSAHPHLTNTQLRAILLRSSNNFPRPNNIRGYGLLSAKKAVEYPNIEVKGTDYIVHKRFVDTIDTTHPVYALFTAGSKTDSALLSLSSSGSYTGAIPVYAPGQYLKFRISYKNSAGAYSFYPASGILGYSYGSNIFDVYKEPRVLFGFEISKNYPNPFSTRTTMSLNSAYKDEALVEIYDVLGRKIKTIHDGLVSSGPNYFTWNGRDNNGIEAAAGVYILTAKMGKAVKAEKLLLIR